MVDVLQYLEGATYAAFIVGALVAVYELRAMSRDRRIELKLREIEFFCSREFEEATVNAVKGNFEPGKVSDVDMKMLADYWDGMAEMVRTKLIAREDVGLDFASVWEAARPWTKSWEDLVGEGRFGDWERIARQEEKYLHFSMLKEKNEQKKGV